MKNYISVLLDELQGRRVSTMEDVKDVLGLWNLCDYDALKVARYHVGKALGRFCVDIYMSGGRLYAKCRA